MLATFEHGDAAILGSPTTIARACARETATLIRFLSSKNSIPLGLSSPTLVHIDTITTAASCP